jgi:hypothetical protein
MLRWGGKMMEAKERTELWDKYEKIAMHFNELLIRLRTQALGAVATIVTAAGFLMSRESSTEPWWAVSAVSVLVLIAWCTLWMIDVCYYSRLLRGAVNALLKIERESEGMLELSTAVEKLFGVPDENAVKLNWPVRLFYVPIFMFLFVASAVSISKAVCR